jgi:ketosteroid isomerase-like protein
MSKLCTTAISLILLAAPAIAAEHTKDEAQKAVTEFTEHYQNLFNSKNTKGILDLYAKDGVEVAPGQPIMTSKADIEKRFERLFTNGATDLKYEVKQVEPPGKYVFAVGQFTVKESPPAGSAEARQVSGNFLNIYEWDGDSLKYRVRATTVPVNPQQR